MPNPNRIPIHITNSGVSLNANNAYPIMNQLTAATPDFDWETWGLAQDLDGSLFGDVTVPKTIGPNPNAKIILVIMANAITGVTRLHVDARTTADGEPFDNALDLTMASQDVSVPGTAYTRKDVSFTLPTTGNGFPVAGDDILRIRIFHEGTHVNDLLAADTILVKAYLEVDLE